MNLKITHCIFFMLSSFGYGFDLLAHLKYDFEKSFHERCDKYPFVNRFINKLEYTDDRYLTFVYQESRFKNGGLGDRIGGLISAVAMSIRFNRTLLIRESNGMHEVFRPYHPTDIHNSNPKYSWFNITSWSNFNYKFANNDATEYDLYDCINNTGGKTGHCSMDGADASTPHILYRSNRAYICHYDVIKSVLAHKDMLDILGVDEHSDLYEVGGCMMRLALWPTEKLWEEAIKFYQQQLPNVALMPKTVVNEPPLPSTTTMTTATTITQATTMSTKKVFFQVGMHYRCGDKSYIMKGGYDHYCIFDPSPGASNPSHLIDNGNPYAIAMCARRSIQNLTIPEAVAFNNNIDESANIGGAHQPHLRKLRSNSDSSGSSRKLNAVSTGLTSSLDNSNEDVDSSSSSIVSSSLHQTHHMMSHEHNHQHHHLNHQQQQRNQSIIINGVNITPILSFVSTPENLSPPLLVSFIASDNAMSSVQMNTTLDLPHSHNIISPQGCHIEMDPSPTCHRFTATQWFILSMSDILVVQSLPASSSFSRYAGLYGLKADPFRDSMQCDSLRSNFGMSRLQQSNWFCC